MADYNIQMTYFNGTSYDNLYPIIKQTEQYLPLSGGTMEGNITLANHSLYGETNQYISFNNNRIMINSDNISITGDEVRITGIPDPTSDTEPVNLRTLLKGATIGDYNTSTVIKRYFSKGEKDFSSIFQYFSVITFFWYNPSEFVSIETATYASAINSEMYIEKEANSNIINIKMPQNCLLIL